MDDKTLAILYEEARFLTERFYFWGGPFDQEDLIQIAVMAAWETLPRYSGSKGYKLLTYLSRRMEGAVQDYIRAYTAYKRKGEGYREHKTKTFSELYGEDCDFDLTVTLPGHEPAPGYMQEVRDSLRHYREEFHIDDASWLLLWLRFGMGLNQTEAGQFFGVNDTTISKRENRVCAVLGIKPPGKMRAKYRELQLTEAQREKRRQAGRLGGIACGRNFQARKAAANSVMERANDNQGKE